MPKKETRYTQDKRHVLRTGEYERTDGKQGFQYKLWNPITERFHTCSAPTLKELREKEKIVQNEVNSGIAARRGKDTLDAYYEIWAAGKHIRPNVMSNYQYMYKRFIRPVLGQKKLRDIKFSTIKTFYLDLLTSETLAINTLEVVHTVLHGILRVALLDDVIRRNPTDEVMAELKSAFPAPEKRRALTMEEQQRFIEVLNREELTSWKPAFMILLRTGMRVGELTGLTWNDIDEESGVIHVRRTLVFFKNESVGRCGYAINSTKTVASTRDLPLTPELRELFRMQREQAPQCRQTIDGVTDFVFVNRFGDVQHQGTLNRALRRIITAANADAEATPLPHFSCHHLRHTCCTNMIAAGVELTAASALLGHRDIRTTANIYNDVQEPSKKKAMTQLSEYTA